MSTIAVTGGAGFVGTNLVRSLLSEKFKVIVIDDFSTGLRSNVEGLGCEVREVSLLNEPEIQDALTGSDYIFHLAARGSVPRSIRNPRATHEVNTTGTMNVLEFARKHRTPLSFTSSSSVYGTNGQLPKNEKMWTSPMTPYAASKLAGEALVHSYALSYDITAVTYRFFNVFGPWQRPDHEYAAVIPKWIWKIMHNEKIQVYGDGEQSRDFTFVDDVVRILLAGMKQNIYHPDPLNLAFGERITLNELLNYMKERKPDLEVEYLPERSGDVKNSQNDPKELKRVFPDVRPRGFRAALFQVWDWLENDSQKVLNGPQVSD
jgi:UDP-glucose 4-epimerase